MRAFRRPVFQFFLKFPFLSFKVMLTLSTSAPSSETPAQIFCSFVDQCRRLVIDIYESDITSIPPHLNLSPRSYSHGATVFHLA